MTLQKRLGATRNNIIGNGRQIVNYCKSLRDLVAGEEGRSAGAVGEPEAKSSRATPGATRFVFISIVIVTPPATRFVFVSIVIVNITLVIQITETLLKMFVEGL